MPVDGRAYVTNEQVTALDNTGGLVNAGHTFSGWNTAADGSGTNRAAGGTFLMGAANVTLYARWADEEEEDEDEEEPAPRRRLPEGPLLDRQVDSVFAGQTDQFGGVISGAVYQIGVPPTITIPISTESPGSDYSLQIYHWQVLSPPAAVAPGCWVALATTMKDGRATAVNDGGYTGWFSAWWVIEPRFIDVDGSWALDEIRRMNGMGMIEGYPASDGGLNRPFYPDQPITRTELTLIAARIMGLNPGTNAYAKLQPLSDAQADAILQEVYVDWKDIPDWAKTYIAAMTQAGYVQGMDGSFDGDSYMTRVEAGVLVSNILKAVGYTRPANLTRFNDAGSLPDWAGGRLVDGVLEGSDGLLRPNDTITRAEETALLLRLLRALGW